MKTPGVYVQEVPTLPPSVAEVATAIPAFIGYTEKGKAGAVEVAQVNSLLEYEERFGRPKPTAFSTAADGSVKPLASNVPETPLWYAINLYFKNGGGRCYVVSVGSYQDALSGDDFQAGLTALEAEDEPTLIVMPGAVALAKAGYDSTNQAALAHCKKMGDRFAIFDVKDGDVAAFRTGVGTNDLSYGAAYYPYLNTALPHVVDEAPVKMGDADDAPMLTGLRTSNTALYNQVKKNLAEQRVDLPPSAAIAGIYARVDRDRGVWKAPANASLSSVIGPAAQVTADQQETLNVDATSGKSINVIRA